MSLLPPAEILSAIALRLRAGETITDEEFDQVYPPEVRACSRMHWTPVSVALRAAALLVEQPGTRVCDLGAGPGKFCLVGALVTEGIFTGVEQRTSLVEIATDLSRRALVPRVSFVCENINKIDWDAFDAFYLYNPFCENVHQTLSIDDSMPMSSHLHRHYVRYTAMQLGRARPGTRVALYHGYGGRLPEGYREERVEFVGSGMLKLWVKED